MHYNTIQYLQQCTFERIFRDTFTALCLNSIPYSNEQRIRELLESLVLVAYSPSLALELNNITVLLIFYAANNCCVEFLNKMNE